MSERSTRGFSFIELLASLAILGLLASLAMPLAQNTVRREKERDLRRALREIRIGIDAYKAAADSGEISKDEAASGYPPTLTSLVEGIPAARADGRTLYFLRRLPRDPFFSDLSTPAALTWGLRSSASSAEKPQKGNDVFDVYSLTDDMALNGTPYKEW